MNDFRENNLVWDSKSVLPHWLWNVSVFSFFFHVDCPEIFLYTTSFFSISLTFYFRPETPTLPHPTPEKRSVLFLLVPSNLFFLWNHIPLWHLLSLKNRVKLSVQTWFILLEAVVCSLYIAFWQVVSFSKGRWTVLYLCKECTFAVCWE